MLSSKWGYWNEGLARQKKMKFCSTISIIFEGLTKKMRPNYLMLKRKYLCAFCIFVRRNTPYVLHIIEPYIYFKSIVNNINYGASILCICVYIIYLTFKLQHSIGCFLLRKYSYIFLRASDNLSNSLSESVHIYYHKIFQLRPPQNLCNQLDRWMRKFNNMNTCCNFIPTTVLFTWSPLCFIPRPNSQNY